ncbi:MAG: DUF2779 domain-containing protein [Candidatus Neomarinimicrobiota bacterium]
MDVHQPELAAPPSLIQQRAIEQGLRVGELARQHFPGGVLIEFDPAYISEALADTRRAISQGHKTIFEGAFEFHDVLVRVDVLERQADIGWRLVEVKSSTGVKPEHIQDVAIQAYVLNGAGLETEQFHLMHLNKACTYPELSNLFTLEDLTPQVQGQLSIMAARVDDFHQVLDLPEAPEVLIGQHCNRPYRCPFEEHCWEWVPPNSIFSIPRLTWPRKEQLLREGLIEITRLPTDFPMGEQQARYVESARRQQPIVDWQAIRQELSRLVPPIHFLDFETDAPAVPRFEGLHPYENFPFQFSCHILLEAGGLSHTEYLHQDDSDPRPPLLDALLPAISPTGSVVAYNAPFERSVLKALMTWFPEKTRQLQSISDRLWDQLKIFQKYYTDYRFDGSCSLKSVLPVLVPSMSYQDLAIQQGDAAQATWNLMLKLPPGRERRTLIKDLKKYCGQDTLAMAALYNYLITY